MEKYTILCTEEQTKMALILGAQLIEHPFEASIIKAYEDRFKNLVCIKERYYLLPSAEQMIGFLYDYNPEKSITVTYDRGKWIYFIGDDECATKYDTRKEATLAAIDEVLNYFTEE